MVKVNFELDTPVYDTLTKRYVYRVYDDVGRLAYLLVEEKSNKNVGNFIKSSLISKLSFATRNPQRHCMEIVSFNIPKDNVAYKGIFHKKALKPKKVFVSTEEGKWNILNILPNDILLQMQEERTFLKSFIYKMSTEIKLFV